MRIWTLKLTGLLVWGLFLFLPFTARADDGFDTTLPIEASDLGAITLSVGDYNMHIDNSALQIPVEDKWSLKLDAGADTVLRNDLSAKIRHDRVPLDNGGRESFRFGVGLNYQF